MWTGTSPSTLLPRAHLCTGASAVAAQRATSAIGASWVKVFDQAHAVVRTDCNMRKRDREEESGRTERCAHEQVDGGRRNDVEGERCDLWEEKTR